MSTYIKTWLNTVQLTNFQDWTDQFGMTLDNNRGDTGGNGILYTAHYVTGLVQKNNLSDNERARITQVYLNNFRFPGVLMRAPSKPNDREAQDDVIGLMSADAQMNPDPKYRMLTRAIYEHGRDTYCDGVDKTDIGNLKTNTWVFRALKALSMGKVRWTWNNVSQNKFHISSWLQRRMEMMATMQMCLKEQVNPFYWLYWAAVMYGWAKFSNNAQGGIPCYHMAIASQGYGFLTNWICKRVHARIASEGGLGVILGQYFNNPSNPLIELLKDIS